MEKHSEDSQDPLLRQSTEEDVIHSCDSSSEHKNGRQPIRTWLRSNALLLVILVLLLYIAIALTADVALRFAARPSQPSSHDEPSLLADVLQYEERPEWFQPEHPWDQDPSDELDAAWDNLLYAINLRISDDELDILGINKTNRVQVNGGAYIGSMGVYHHLHCLNNLRMIVHWDYYEPKFADSPYLGHLGKAHSDHCITALRQALMCHANTAITTFEWVDEETPLHGKEQRLEAMTTCAKWNSLDDWARQRVLVAGNYTYRPGPFSKNKAHNKDIE
ncbi:uncharacterized protein F4822DRAFT_350352 [Hypoxylon trugodes]|uniref:uncharacterized protein n=1 Tax=Hypoxylon trugodes TaxID=326681 RepID=UPI00219F8C43|nr:uncharacterized protein F4822DRAFT_350352 [Hypoxylon trugodes]KAI1385646.1 hypothetical protein F4822DRAFT_350352 [Hypoxylon trugodes]